MLKLIEFNRFPITKKLCVPMVQALDWVSAELASTPMYDLLLNFGKPCVLSPPQFLHLLKGNS